MRQEKQKSGIVSGIMLPMGLVCLFAFCSLALALLGGRAYKQIQGSVDDSYGTTVAASYLRTKLSQNNSAGAVSLRSQDGAAVLVIAAAGEGAGYETRIFMSEGVLVETFGSAGLPLDAIGANRIAALRRCDFSLQENGLVSAELESREGTVLRTAFALTMEGDI